MPEITFDQFAAIDLRVGKILSAEPVQGADKLMHLTVDVGASTEDNKVDVRTVVAGIKQYYSPEDLVGKTVVVVVNLAPRKLRGITSTGMLLACHDESGSFGLLAPDKPILPGSKIG